MDDQEKESDCLMYDDLNLGDTVLVKLGDLEGEVLIVNALMKFGEIALDLEQQACKRVSIAPYPLEGFVIDVEDLEEIAEQRLALEDVSIGIDTHIVLLLLVILIVDLADNLLEDILQGDETAGTTKLVDHDGDMNLVLLELAQQVVDASSFPARNRADG